METDNTAKKNRFELVTKVVTAIGALLAGIFIPVVIHYNEEKNRETQLYVQIMTQREQSDSALRSQMFNSLISSYFGQEILRDPEKQMMYLHLLTLNFQEFFDARPLEMTLCAEETEECKRMDTFTLKGKKKRSFPFAVLLRDVAPSEIRVRVSSAPS